MTARQKRAEPDGAGRGVLALLVLVALLAVACVPVEAIEQADREAAINHGHAADASLPMSTRMVGADNTRAWRAQRRSLSGKDVPGADTWPALPPELGPVAPVTTEDR